MLPQELPFLATLRRELQLSSNLALNILIAEKIYGLKVVQRSNFPKARKKFFYNTRSYKKVKGKMTFTEKPLPNYVKETKNILEKILQNDYSMFVEKHGYLYRTVVNDVEVIDDLDRSIAIALLVNILGKGIENGNTK